MASKDKLWVVEALTDDGWEMCNFTGLPFTSHRFLEVHRMRKKITDKLLKLKCAGWKKNMIRVVEYKRK